MNYQTPDRTPQTPGGHENDSALLAAVDAAVAEADRFRCPTAMIDTPTLRAVAELLRVFLAGSPAPARPAFDPFFVDAGSHKVVGKMADIQRELRPQRAAPRPTPQRTSAIGHIIDGGVTEADLLATWRWWLREWPDEYKGGWIDTFVAKYHTYAEHASSGTVDDDAGKFTIPKMATTEDAAADLMRRADNAGLEGGK